MSTDRRDFMKMGSALLTLGAGAGLGLLPAAARAAEMVRVGLLHSMSGTLAIYEAALLDAEKLAIDEINASGGVLGRTLAVVVEDGASDPAVFAEKARKLLERDQVAVIVGTASSSSRKAVLPVLRRAAGVLFYPVFYEGQEQDPAVVYTSQEATQSVIPSMQWLLRNKGKKVFMIGSDYIYPRTCNRIARQTVTQMGGIVAGEEYVPFGHTEFSAIINKIKAAGADCIYCTVVGGSVVSFFKQLRAAGLDGAKITLLSTALTENEIDGIGKDNALGYYSCAGYFQSIASPANERFIKAFRTRYGQARVIGDPMAVAYNSVYLWKMAVEKAGSFEPAKVLAAAAGLEIEAPEGRVRVHASNQHVWKKVRIGRARADGQFDIVWESAGPVEPNPFPKLSVPA
ncbi:MAG: transporter substrate-binding protein [Pseudomonadota bacterium]